MENDVLELVQVQNTSMNSILKRKCTKDKYKFRKLYDTKARNNQSNKSTTRSNDNYGIT